MRTSTRYLLLQVPELAGLAVLLWLVSSWLGLLGSSPAIVLWLAYAALQLFLYPFVRRAYETTPSAHGSEALIGARAVVTEILDPEGWVRVRQELWQAELSEGADGPVEPGSWVRVQEVNELTLKVRRDGPAQSSEGPSLSSARSRAR